MSWVLFNFEISAGHENLATATFDNRDGHDKK